MAGILWAAWLALSVWGVVSGWRAGRVVLPTRLRWLSDWRGWILALSVASFAPALAPDASLPAQVALTLLAGAGLLRLMHALDSRLVGQGVVAGLGLVALVLDSLSEGAWARSGALGHGTEAHGVGVLYGALALLWGLTVVRAWLQIEGNPLGAALGLGALACWLGWKGLTPAVGWGAAAGALALGAQLLTRELAERRRVRLMLQNRLVRIVRRASNADLALTGVALMGVCLLALWLSGMPIPEMPRLGAHAGWQVGVLVVAALGMRRRQSALTPFVPLSRTRARGSTARSCEPPASAEASLQHSIKLGSLPSHSGRAAGGEDRQNLPSPPFARGERVRVRGDSSLALLPALALLALLGGEPLTVAALASLFFWTSVGQPLQEHPPHASNTIVRTGGNT